MNKIFKLLSIVLLVVTTFSFNACKKSFDNPPGATDQNIVANTTIQSLKAMHTTPSAYDIITTDVIISGIVVANDKSGNMYKQLYIMDATGGLQIQLDATNLYGSYPVGRRIYIYCKNLCISDYNGTMQLGVKATVAGLPSFEGIPGNLISRYVVGGSINNPVVPIVVTQSQLGTNMQDRYLGSLIQLDGYEFNDTTVTYADTSVYKNTVNRDIKSCAGQTITIRSSGYSNFAGAKVPGGSGSIVAIYTVFGSTRQLILREKEDVKFTSGRCNLFEEYFSALTSADNFNDFNFAGWKNIAPNSSALYKNTVFGSTGKAVKVTAFGTGLSLDTAWLITPTIALPTATSPMFAFSTAYQFATGPTTLHAFVSTNYNGGNDPNTATWTQLTNSGTNIPGNTANNNSSTWSSTINISPISLAAYAGQNIRIAFKYTGGNTGNRTTNFQVDDIRVTRQ